MINFMFWNVRGIASLSSIRRLRKLCRLHNISLLFLFEPFLSEDRFGAVNFTLHFSSFLYSTSNKILVLWRHDFEVSLVAQSEQFLHLQVRHPSTSALSYITGVYAKSTRLARQELWTDLLNLYIGDQRFYSAQSDH